MNSRTLLRRNRQSWFLVQQILSNRSWCTPGALLVHSWCTPGALLVHFLVHSWCTPGALLVHSWCTPGALSWCTPGALLVHSWCTPGALTPGALSVHSKGFPKGNCFASERKPRSSDRLFARNVWIAFSLTYKPERELHFRKEAKKRLDRKGIAPLPKGSLDPPHRNVWIAFSPTCKPERELHRFRKEASILRTETFGSPFRQLANPKGKLHRFRKEASILRTETFGSPKTLPHSSPKEA